MSVIIRAAVAFDMDAIAHIYAHHVNHGTATFETEAPDSSEIGRRWTEVTAKGLPWMVADDGGEVVGYAYARALSSSTWRISIRSKTSSMSKSTVWAPAWADC